MVKSFTLAFFVLCSTVSFAQTSNVGIGTTTPDASSILDLKSNSKVLLVPRLTTNQRLAILKPAEGVVGYESAVGCFFYFKNNQWASLCS